MQFETAEFDPDVPHFWNSAALVSSFKDFFDSIDEDGSGEIEADELCIALRNMGDVSFTRRKLNNVDENLNNAK